MHQYKETVHWIIGGLDKMDKYDKAIEFVHSFGLKCDCVGWCTVKLENEKDFELIERIKEKANALKGRTRIVYERKILDEDTEWYMLDPKKEVEYEWKSGIKAYKLPPSENIAEAGTSLVVSQKFVDFCSEQNYTGVTFAYIPDIGRYQAPTFYIVIPDEVPKFEFGCGRCFTGNYKHNKKLYEKIDSYGGNMSRIASCFNSVEFVDLPIFITKEGEPKADFCYIIYQDKAAEYYLIRKKVANALIDNKIIKRSDLVPVPYCDAKDKELLYEVKKSPIIDQEVLDYWEKNRDKFEKKKKPSFVPSEKLALQLLRKAKKERGEDFNRSLSKVFLEKIEDDLAILSPIFKITNGCYLNDEICLFSYNEIERETGEFLELLKDEKQLVEDMPELLTAKTIGTAADGDKILLLNDSTIMRYQHEDAYLSEKYKSIWEFIFETI